MRKVGLCVTIVLAAGLAIAPAAATGPVSQADVVNLPAEGVINISVNRFGVMTMTDTFADALWSCYATWGPPASYTCTEEWLVQDQRPQQTCARMIVHATTTGGAVRGEVVCRDRANVARTSSTDDVVGIGSDVADAPLGNAHSITCTAWGILGQDAPVAPYNVWCGDPPDVVGLLPGAPAG